MTKLVIRNRQGGKTLAMMEWAHGALKDGITPAIVTISEPEARRVRKLYEEKYGVEVERVRFMSHGQARNGSLDGRHTKIGVDNLDMLLRHLFGYPVDIATFTYEANT